ncbi:pseudouridine synthase [Pilobolus umbonatus]|nr:pseudouridine synthase [Pilobolus umbonatus]
MDRLREVNVVYEDKDWLVIDKPYDCRIQDDPQLTDPSVRSLLRVQRPDLPKLRNVHQLDYATSGLYLFALNKKTAAEASRMFRERTVKKTYLAIVKGHLCEDKYVVNQPIDDDPDHSFRMKLASTGKPAETLVHVLQRGVYHYQEEKTGEKKEVKVTKVSLSPITGRRHQLRLHMKYLGHPILGDYNYEEDYTDTFRMMLHAYQIQLPSLLDLTTEDPFIGLIEQ